MEMSESEQMVDVTAYLDRDVVEAIKDELGYGDSLSAFVREAVEEKLDRTAHK